MIRSPLCTYNTEQTVLAHWRDNTTGMGQKEKDLVASWACYECHRLVDGEIQNSGFTREEIKQMHLEGIIRTQQELIREGVVKW